MRVVSRVAIRTFAEVANLLIINQQAHSTDFSARGLFEIIILMKLINVMNTL